MDFDRVRDCRGSVGDEGHTRLDEGRLPTGFRVLKVVHDLELMPGQIQVFEPSRDVIEFLPSICTCLI